MTVHFVNLLDAVRRRSLRMAALVEDLVAEACDAVNQRDEALAKRVIGRDNDVDSEEVAVEAEVIRLLALYQPVGSDLRTLCGVLKVNNDLERVADCAVNIAERARHLQASHPEEVAPYIIKIQKGVIRSLRLSIQSFASDDASIARAVLLQDDEIDAQYAEIIRTLIRAGSQRPKEMAMYLDLLSIAKNLERIADHATNIAEDVIYMATGQIVRHQPRPSVAPQLAEHQGLA